jgi:DMSO/TMAO reductase YedYZ molybdopterin-dependent catalytic subunit
MSDHGRDLPPDTLAGKRQRFIEKQRALHPERTDVGARVGADGRPGPPRGEGPPNRHGLPKLPVAQRRVPNWPVLDLGHQPDVPLAAWRLRVDGLVENPLELDWSAYQALPQVEEASDFHCVTGWSRMDMVWRGVRLRDLCELVVPQDAARFVLFTAYDRAPGTDIPYTTSIPLARALDPDVLVAHAVDGAPLAREHGGPVRVVTPRLYAWKGAKWVARITFLAQDEPGFWEVRGYSNSADPWTDDRYSGAPPPGANSLEPIF